MKTIPRIYINPGHSDRDPGAVGYETERRLNVKVSQYQSEYLLEHYVCETKIGSNDDLMVVVAEANAWKADLITSNHNNAGKGDGYECYVYNEVRVPMGEIFAKYVAETGQNLRLYGAAPGVKLRPGLTILACTNMPAILNEGAFVDNWEDIQDWNDDAELKKLGEAYAKASAEFLNLEEKPKADSTLKLRTLSNGYTGEDVRALQILLNGRGEKYNCGAADGIFGSKTENAVRRWQTDHNMPVTGTADVATMGSLLGLK